MYIIKNISHEDIQLSVDEKKPQNVQNSLMTIKEMYMVAILFLRDNNIPRQTFVMMNIYPANLRTLLIIPFALEGVTGKSLRPAL